MSWIVSVFALANAGFPRDTSSEIRFRMNLSGYQGFDNQDVAEVGSASTVDDPGLLIPFFEGST